RGSRQLPRQRPESPPLPLSASPRPPPTPTPVGLAGAFVTGAGRVARPGYGRRGPESAAPLGGTPVAATVARDWPGFFHHRATAAGRTHRRFAGPRYARPRGPHHGHHAQRGGDRLHPRSRLAPARHGLHAHQLRPR